VQAEAQGVLPVAFEVYYDFCHGAILAYAGICGQKVRKDAEVDAMVTRPQNPVFTGKKDFFEHK
jgi:hypothetical protein